jgi:hypothetical protein
MKRVVPVLLFAVLALAACAACVQPQIPAKDWELTAVVTVSEMWNQPGARRAGPPPTSSESFRF